MSLLVFARLSTSPNPALKAIFIRSIMSKSTADGLVLGYFKDLTLTPSSSQLPAESVKKLENLLKVSGAQGKAGESRIFFGVEGLPPKVALVSFGNKDTELLVKLENARKATAIGAKLLRAHQVTNVEIDASIDSHTAAEGVKLGTYKFEGSKAKTESEKQTIEYSPLGIATESKLHSSLNWDTGLIYAKAQNRARQWMDAPANQLTPTIFAEQIEKFAQGLENTEVYVRDLEWIKEKKMGSFLSVAAGSDQEPRLVEVHYRGGSADQKPIAFVGKGITFDTGGISLKPSTNMHDMKGDMGGAATSLAATLAVAELKLPVNVICVVALSENMPNGNATKPGDVVTAMNGKSIEILNTDAEGRLVMADALYYTCSTYQPHTVMTVATLTGAIVIALGNVYAAAFSTSESLWKELENAGKQSGDPFWRMPLNPSYQAQITRSNVADLANIGERGGGSCSAAAFMREFLPKPETKDEFSNGSAIHDWNEDPSFGLRYAHLDIAGVMDTASESGYLTKGMSGRPTRTFIELLRNSIL